MQRSFHAIDFDTLMIVAKIIPGINKLGFSENLIVDHSLIFAYMAQLDKTFFYNIL